MWAARIPIIRFVVGAAGAEKDPFMSQGVFLGPRTMGNESITAASLD